MDLRPEAWLDLTHTAHPALFLSDEPVWQAIARIAGYLAEQIPPGGCRTEALIDPLASVGPEVILEEGVVVEAFAVIKGPAWIGRGSLVRSGAYVRENVIAGEGVTLGHSSEFKNCVLFDHCEVPHFNYVGDSLLGHKAHLGAGVILSNVRLDRANIRVRTPDGSKHDTGLRKFGAIIGDHSEIGCNSVISPGSLLGRNTLVHPCTLWRGVLDHGRTVKNSHPSQLD